MLSLKFQFRFPFKHLTVFILCTLLGSHGAISKPLKRYTITHYQHTFIPGLHQNKKVIIAIRQFERDGIPHYLVVNPHNLKTYILPQSSFSQFHMDQNELNQTPYYKALEKYSSPPYSLHNQGIQKADHAVHGVFLTIDMCPSKKVFEKKFFQTLVNIANKHKKPVPIALAISSAWIHKHSKNFKWLLTQQKKNKLQITWVNHSHHHFYDKKLPLEQNFLLHSQTNMTNEILGPEKLLLEYGQIPSIFFRFPGLVSDENLILTLKDFGLIPLGSNAWVAKGESIKPGCIVLVHGNSNEPKGIKMIIKRLRTLTFLPLHSLF